MLGGRRCRRGWAHLIFMLSAAQNIIQSTPSATPPRAPYSMPSKCSLSFSLVFVVFLFLYFSYFWLCMRHVNVECELQSSIYRIFAGYVYVCVCMCLWEIWHMSWHDGCCFLQYPDPVARVASTFCSLSAHGARSSINQLISLEFMFCCGVALRSDATCPTMCPFPFASFPPPRSRLASIWAGSRVVFLFLFCLPRILLHFYSCWRACFAAIASFAAMSWPCCMWHASSGVRQLGHDAR